MSRLLLGGLVFLLAASCEGTPLPADESDEDEVMTIDPLTTSLTADQAGVAVEQLAAALLASSDARERLLAALESPRVQIDDESLGSAFRALVANQFEVGWLAFLLTLAAEQQASAEADAAAAALRGLGVATFREAIAVGEIQLELLDGLITLNEARSELETNFDLLRPAGEDDNVVLLPEGAPDPTLSLARGSSRPVVLAEHTTGFTTAASAVDQSTTAEVISGEEVSSSRVRLAALTRLALLTGRASDPPHSAFGRYVLTVPAPEQVVYSLAGRETIGTVQGEELPVVALDVDAEGTVGATIIDVEPGSGELQVRSSSRASLGREDPTLPAFGRPAAELRSAFDRYQLVVQVPFVNPANAPFRVTCLVPSLGARITMTLAGRGAQGELRNSGRLNLAPIQLGELDEDPQVVCAGSYGTVETGRIAIPAELVPEEAPEE